MKATTGSVEVVKQCPCSLADQFVLRMLLESFKKPPDVAVRNIK